MENETMYMELSKEFFDNDNIKILRSYSNGDSYVLFMLNLYVSTLKDDNALYVNLGYDKKPYTYKELSEMTNTPIDTVIVAMKILNDLGIVFTDEKDILPVFNMRF